MESTMEQIRTRLQGGETPQELIKKGFKKTTVYSVAQKVKAEPKKDSNDQSLDRDIYLARLLQSTFFDLFCEIYEPRADKGHYDPAKAWDSCVKTATERFEEDTGRKPPEDFLTE